MHKFLKKDFINSFGSEGFLLDNFPGASLALGLRKLKSDYNGSCLRIRNSSTNMEADIGFSNNHSIDADSLIGFSSNSSSFVVRAYDLSANNNHNTQSITTNQPKIITSGVVEKWNGKPTLVFDGVDDLFFHPNIPINGFSIFVVLKITNTLSGNKSIFSSSNSNNNSGMMILANTPDTAWGTYAGNTIKKANTNLASGSISLLEMHGYMNGTGIFYRNGVIDGSFDGTSSQFQSHVGGINGQSVPMQLSELIFYPFNNESNRAGIATNINSYFSIY